MEIETEIKAVRDTFAAFVSAVKDSNFSSYLSLHSEEVAGEVNEELFVRNCARAKAHSFDFDWTASSLMDGSQRFIFWSSQVTGPKSIKMRLS